MLSCALSVFYLCELNDYYPVYVNLLYECTLCSESCHGNVLSNIRSN